MLIQPEAADDVAAALADVASAPVNGTVELAGPEGQWGVDDQGQFWSFWPPTYRATYEVSWITDADGDVVGIRFTELNRGATSEGRYTPKLT